MKITINEDVKLDISNHLATDDDLITNYGHNHLNKMPLACIKELNHEVLVSNTLNTWNKVLSLVVLNAPLIVKFTQNSKTKNNLGSADYYSVLFETMYRSLKLHHQDFSKYSASTLIYEWIKWTPSNSSRNNMYLLHRQFYSKRKQIIAKREAKAHAVLNGTQKQLLSEKQKQRIIRDQFVVKDLIVVDDHVLKHYLDYFDGGDHLTTEQQYLAYLSLTENLLKLDTKTRNMVMKYWVEGQSYTQIAKEYQVSCAWVQVHVSEAIKRFRKSKQVLNVYE